MAIDPQKLGELQDPLPDPLAPTDAGKRFLSRCNDLLDNSRASWAWDTVLGLRETVRRLGQPTPDQDRALDNIEAAVTRQEEAGEDKRTRGGSRRYEGWGRR